MNQTIKDIVNTTNRTPEREQFKLFTALQATQMVYSEKDNFVQFKVKGDRDVNKVKVIFDNDADLYNLEFWKIRGLKCDLKDTITGLYNDQVTDAIWRRVVLI